MNRMLGGILVLVFGLSVAAGEEKPATVAEQYAALVKEYHVSTGALARAKTDEERQQAIARVDVLPRRLLELAEKNPSDPIAIDALSHVVWVEGNTSHPAGGRDSPGGRAIAILLRDHVRSDKLGMGCVRLASGFRKECETLLRTVLEMNPHKDVQALACLGLAQFLQGRLDRFALMRDRPDMAERYAGFLDKEYLEKLRRQDRARVIPEVEALFERAAAEFGDVKHPYGGSVGDIAKGDLYEIRFLSVGREAPDIAGEDQNGQRFKLSDYRGKVVLLDFWQQT